MRTNDQLSIALDWVVNGGRPVEYGVWSIEKMYPSRASCVR